MNKSESILVLDWYLELENRLSGILKTVPFSNDTQGLFLPPLANILIDSGSLVDTVLRELYSGPKRRDDLNIREYCLYYEPLKQFSKVRSVLYQMPLTYIEPFAGWYKPKDKSYIPRTWWQGYNSVKHDRLKEYPKATLKNVLHALCALHQVIAQFQEFKRALLIKDMIFHGRWAEKYALDVVYSNDEHPVTVMVESELFGTPLGCHRFPNDIAALDPFYFPSKKLARFAGRDR